MASTRYDEAAKAITTRTRCADRYGNFSSRYRRAGNLCASDGGRLASAVTRHRRDLRIPQHTTALPCVIRCCAVLQAAAADATVWRCCACRRRHGCSSWLFWEAHWQISVSKPSVQKIVAIGPGASFEPGWTRYFDDSRHAARLTIELLNFCAVFRAPADRSYPYRSARPARWGLRRKGSSLSTCRGDISPAAALPFRRH